MIRNLLERFRKKNIQKEDMQIEQQVPVFDKKYKTILSCKYNNTYYKIVDWINENSIGSVHIEFGYDSKLDTNFTYRNNIIYIGFENSDDALVFKIKYSM